ncbi:hypothetical protein G3480_22195 [Thiorhodococcus mannitoliphagus]|uniref:Uncharacterized protein n=1 Tax=Thiorhodococcus mannitoliphagus TaxID=329406 RepID=A0A6P1DXC9_9GAMM|nr:hypothetical protein [Thiorhodococcus mannitoliphagus]NEX22977.1 hypothetical protein [Thiorhodococcus mannitoliphagus]
MNPKNLAFATIGSLLLLSAFPSWSDEEVITNGLDVDVRQYIDESPQGQPDPAADQGVANVQDLGDGSTNEGGPPDGYFDVRDAALDDEQNLGPNAPGYIP